ncbi:MAG: exosortase/archaeosortase family protein [Bacteroidales bacterium]|nr:exosortase/archaeosortase family protein [Bacteroidales bacterium]
MKKIKELIEKYKLHAFRDVAIFMIILIVFHFLWKFFIGDILSIGFINDSAKFLSLQVFIAAQGILNILHVNYTAFDQMIVGEGLRNNVIYLPEVNGYVSVNLSCSGLKQFYQFFFLLLLYPGPWKHKLWFIPMGIIIIHIVNVFRIVIMTYVTLHAANSWDFYHDYIVRPFFYVVMFFLWVWWNEKFYLRNKQKKAA